MIASFESLSSFFPLWALNGTLLIVAGAANIDIISSYQICRTFNVYNWTDFILPSLKTEVCTCCFQTACKSCLFFAWWAMGGECLIW